MQALETKISASAVRPQSEHGIVLCSEKPLVMKIGWVLHRTAGVAVIPNLSRILVVFAVAFLPTPYHVFSRWPEGKPPQEPVFSLAVEVPDVIRPVSEIVLETKLTNISQQEISFSGWCPEWMSYLIDVRDHSGNRVPMTRAGENAVCHEPEVITFSPRPVILHSGESLTNYLMLDKLFQLSQAGDYSVSISDHYRLSGKEVTSNVATFVVPSRLPGRGNESRAFSISIRLDERSIPAGWGAPVRIKVTNLSDQTLRWADWEHSTKWEPDEIGTGIVVFDDSGNVIPPMDRPEPDNSKPKEHYPSGELSIADILPGETAERIRVIRRVFDVSKPGSYHVKVSMLDPETSLPVQSNESSFRVEPSKPATDRARKIPPFIVTLRKYPPGFHEDTPYTFLTCMSNISDHEIRLDNVITKDLFTFVDGKGQAVPLPEKWHEIQAALRRLPELVAPTVEGNWSSVKPQWALCGGTSADDVFSGALPGAYKVRVDRYDEPDALPGQKMKELPIVQSNWMTLRVP